MMRAVPSDARTATEEQLRLPLRLLFASVALALVVMAATFPLPQRPHATVRLVIGFTHLVEPQLAAEVLERDPRAPADPQRATARGATVTTHTSQTARALLAALVDRGILAPETASPIADALADRDAPRDATVLFLADLANGKQALPNRNPGVNNNWVHSIYGAWVPRVQHDVLDDGAVLRMLSLTRQRGPAALHALRNPAP